ncbi:peptidoglycan-recognition protein LE-like [Musca vetustissima]|uniref:peptidoglycan-recognition protein LE-like n=1 Tax=Musca vetustissima TaxID=27455 RepID=UPI002AB6AE2E|nr:peptidoglycan-recognition protein LE-like [Musca vetustissima]
MNANDRLRISEENTRNWVNSIELEDSDTCSVVDSIVESSIIESSSDSESGEEHALGTWISDKISATDEKPYRDITQLSTTCPDLEKLTQLVSKMPPPSFGNVSISNSNSVVMGNIIKINGNIIINKDGNSSSVTTAADDMSENNDENPPDLRPERKIEVKKKPVYRPACLIISRDRWLAMAPIEPYNPIDVPTDLVIICHTATVDSTEQAKNIGIIRDIQTFHVETRGWDDIGYNFLIGCDGNVYEGRGWGVEGAHTFRYNRFSIAVAFIGTFMHKLPTQRALNACKNLLKRGVDEDHLTKNFKLMAHNQFMSTASPGAVLCDELKTWEHFYDGDSEELFTYYNNRNESSITEGTTNLK